MAVQEASGLDTDANRERLGDLVPDATDLVVFPEAFARDFGEPGSDLSPFAERLDGPFATALARSPRAGHHRPGRHVRGRRDPHRPLQHPGDARSGQAAYRKIHLYDSFGYRESDALSAGPPIPVVVDVHGFRVGLMTCYDLRFPELARALVDRRGRGAGRPRGLGGRPAQGGPLAHPGPGTSHREPRLRRRRAQPGPRYTGHSMIVTPLGEVLARGRRRAAGPPGDPDPLERSTRHGPPIRRCPTGVSSVGSSATY